MPETPAPDLRLICSLNQIEQTARKAVRGAGLSWGLADDAGKAVRWLHVHGMNGAAVLAALLARQDYAAGAALAPASLTGVWRAAGGALDPLLAGASLSDCFDAPGEARIETAAIAHPLLAAGFIGNLAAIEDRAFVLTWPGVRLGCRRDGLWVEGAESAVAAETADFLCCWQVAAGADARDFPGRRRPPRHAETEVDADAWGRLERHARRTYVETTEASRLAGAGAGLHDND